jgi:hypothetical protein
MTIEIVVGAALAGWTVWYVLRPLLRPEQSGPPRADG